MSAMLYYGLDDPMVSDREFDDGCKRLCREWADLTPHRQWQLGSPEELATSGYHIKVTERECYGAIAWLNPKYQVIRLGEWRKRKRKEQHTWTQLWLPAPMFAKGADTTSATSP